MSSTYVYPHDLGQKNKHPKDAYALSNYVYDLISLNNFSTSSVIILVTDELPIGI